MEPVYDKEKAELHNNKALYQLRKVDSLHEFNLFLYAVYYVLVLITIFLIFYTYDMNKFVKVLSSLLLLFFPIITRILEKSMYNYYQYIIAIIQGIPIEKTK